MKILKFLVISIMFSFVGVISFSINANDETDITYSTFFDLTNEWETYNYYTSTYGIRISNYDFPTVKGQEENKIYYLKIEIPSTSYNIQTVNMVDSQFWLGTESDPDYLTYDLDDLLTPPTLYGTIYVYIENGIGSIVTPLYQEYGINMSDINNFSINMMIDDTSIPSQYYSNWIENSEVGFFLNAIKLEFYNYINEGSTNVSLSLYDTQYLYNDIPNKPTDPTPPTNWEDKTFMGWIFISPLENEYQYYEFNYTIDQNYLLENSGNTVKFFARYLEENEIDIIQPVNPTPDTPDTMGTILNIFGMNNQEGYLLLYLIIHIFLIGLFIAIKRLAGKTPILISSILVTIIFMVFKLLPIYVIIPMIALYVLLFGFKIVTGGVNNEE